MRYKQFKIRNFRGIETARLDLNPVGLSRTFTLVGLNESGKTTVLEALAFFASKLGSDEDEPVVEPFEIDDVHSLIPIAKRDNFSNSITIEATVELSNEDVSKLEQRSRGNGFLVKDIAKEWTITSQITFVDSVHEKTRSLWEFTASAKRKGRRGKFKPLNRATQEEIWAFVVETCRELLPPIVYYPNFLFDFPDRIYLTEHEGESRTEAVYRRLLQDILDSLNRGLDLQKHVVERAERNLESDKNNLESVLAKMSAQVTKLVFKERFSVFGGGSPKQIAFSIPKHDDDRGRYFLTLKVKEGEDSYFIRERSLGFRWFFTFLLFTQFRIERSEGTRPIFLLDEPASNLHSTAQARLLLALEKLTANSTSSVIYTTHSHHLINPAWLENTFVVQNAAMTYNDSQSDDAFNATMTDIKVEPYRRFVIKHPNQRHYYQPILDVLEYRPSGLEDVPNVVMVEGKNDFYQLRYMHDCILKLRSKLHLLPGLGASTLSNAIQLYLGWGRSFIVLLDSDTEGQEQRRRYVETYGRLVQNRIFVLKDAVASVGENSMESLFAQRDRVRFQNACLSDAKEYNKKLFNGSVQQLLASKRCESCSDTTKRNFRKIFNFLRKELQAAK